MADKFITIAEYMDSIQAEMARQTLEDFDIKAVVIGENALNTCLAPTVMTAKLQVLESNADEAKQILEDQQQGHEPEAYEVMDETDEADEPYDPKEEEL
jgi:Putative prokaryotic signal transducing protein